MYPRHRAVTFSSTFTNTGTTELGAGTTIQSPDVNNTGTVQASGSVTVEGDFTQTQTGILDFGLGGAARHAVRVHAHHADPVLDGGVLPFYLDGFVPSTGEQFDVFQADGGITIGSGGLSLTGSNAADFTFALTGAGDTTLQLTYIGAVPEPSTLALLAIGGVGLPATACGGGSRLNKRRDRQSVRQSIRRSHIPTCLPP